MGESPGQDFSIMGGSGFLTLTRHRVSMILVFSQVERGPVHWRGLQQQLEEAEALQQSKSAGG